MLRVTLACCADKSVESPPPQPPTAKHTTDSRGAARSSHGVMPGCVVVGLPTLCIFMAAIVALRLSSHLCVD